MSKRTVKSTSTKQTNKPKGKLTNASLARLYEKREQILGGRKVVTHSTETLRQFRDGGTGYAINPVSPKPPRSR